MAAYVASLRRLAGMPARALYPGHGPVVDDPAAAVAAYLDHRLERERAVLDALEAGDRTAREVVARVYVEVDAALHSAAERSVGAHLDKLAREGLITVEQGVVTALQRR